MKFIADYIHLFPEVKVTDNERTKSEKHPSRARYQAFPSYTGHQAGNPRRRNGA